LKILRNVSGYLFLKEEKEKDKYDRGRIYFQERSSKKVSGSKFISLIQTKGGNT